MKSDSEPGYKGAMTTAVLRKLWNEKVTRGVDLTKEEKDAFIDAYWTGRLPSVPDYSLPQWVEDGCRSFDSHDGGNG